MNEQKTVPTMRTMRAGRPTKYGEAIVARLCLAFADGMSIKSACVVAGIGVTTLAEWREEHPGLEERLNESRELARQKALRAIQAAGERDWRAWAEWLKLAFSADYRGSTKIDVTANAPVSAVTITEERRMEMMERRRKLTQLRVSQQPAASATAIPILPDPQVNDAAEKERQREALDRFRSLGETVSVHEEVIDDDPFGY